MPVVIQMEAVECGAACLSMVLAHHGRYVPLATLRDECQVSRDGTSALQVVRVARSYGMQASGLRRELDTIGDLRTPFIAHWAFNHFVVVEGWDDRGVFIADPASGPRRVDWTTMDRDFTGIAINLDPGDGFKAGGRWPSPSSVLARHARAMWWPLAFTAALGVFLAVAGVASAALLAYFVNLILGGGGRADLRVFFGAIAVALLAQVSLGWIQRQTLLRITTAFSSDLAAQMLWRMLRLPMRFFTQRQPGEIAWRLQLPTALSTALAGPLPTAAVSVVSVIIYFAALLLVSPLAAVVGLVIGLLNFGVLRAIARRHREAQQVVMQESGRLASVTASGLAGIEYLKATGSESESYTRFGAQSALLVNARQVSLQSSRLLDTVPGLLSMLATSAAIGIGAMSVLSGAIAIGGLVALPMLMGGLLAPFSSFVQLGSTWQEVGATLTKVEDVVEQDPEGTGVRTAEPLMVAGRQLSKLTGRIEFRGVVFGYSKGAPPLLRGLSFTVEPGRRLAIVGTSGAGKSTVSRLLAGLEVPWEGEILLDGVPRRDIPLGVLASSLALVDQSIVLFSGSVIDNLRMWDPDIPQETVVAAARDAQIHEVVAARSGGYASPVAEGASNFSGGQAQRLEIARALACDPTILVFDEATSALDAVTEVDIDNAVRRRGCTTVVVAHRMSTIRDADLILVLDQGQVAQAGTHEELIAQDGLYRLLVHS